MGLGDCCINLQENIRESRPAQLAIAFAGGIILMTVLLAIAGTFVRPSCPNCTACFYYAFALNSQQTVCKEALTKNTTCADNLLKNLSIHGLWPTISERRTKRGFVDCTDNPEPFNLEVLTDDDRTRMSHRWKSALKAKTDSSFWRHEWDTHGTCSPYKVKEYFEGTLALDERYPVNRWLAEAAITPTNNRHYSLGEVTTALGKHMPLSSFYLQCLRLKNFKKKGEFLWLYQVVLCIAWSDSRSLIQCPQRPHNETCSDPFYFAEDHTKI